MGEEETRALLRIREDLERRISRLQVEVEDLRRAVSRIDRVIAVSGFQQPAPEAAEAVEEGTATVRARDGTVLGSVRVDEEALIFEPAGDLALTVSTPPFQTFLVDRVLANMRASDEERAAKGEIPPENVLSYEVSTDGERLRRLVIRSYGGERRLREIQSSLRWTLDKMYSKLVERP